MRLFSLSAALVSAALLSIAHAQPYVPKEVSDIIHQTELDTGTARFGSLLMGDLDDGEMETVQVGVAPDKYTFVLISGNDYTLDVEATAYSGATKIVSGHERSDSVVLQIPPTKAHTVRLDIKLGCEEMTCQYFVQAFTR